MAFLRKEGLRNHNVYHYPPSTYNSETSWPISTKFDGGKMVLKIIVLSKKIKNGDHVGKRPLCSVLREEHEHSSHTGLECPLGIQVQETQSWKISFLCFCCSCKDLFLHRSLRVSPRSHAPSL